MDKKVIYISEYMKKKNAQLRLGRLKNFVLKTSKFLSRVTKFAEKYWIADIVYNSTLLKIAENKVRSLYGKDSAEVEKWAKLNSNRLMVSRKDLLYILAVFDEAATEMNISQSDAVGMSETLAQISLDVEESQHLSREAAIAKVLSEFKYNTDGGEGGEDSPIKKNKMLQGYVNYDKILKKYAEISDSHQKINPFIRFFKTVYTARLNFVSDPVYYLITGPIMFFVNGASNLVWYTQMLSVEMPPMEEFSRPDCKFHSQKTDEQTKHVSTGVEKKSVVFKNDAENYNVKRSPFIEEERSGEGLLDSLLNGYYNMPMVQGI